MTLQEDMKREKDDFWAEKEKLIEITMDIIKSTLVYNQHARNYCLDKLYVKITKEFEIDYPVAYFILHVGTDPDFRVQEMRELNYFETKTTEVANKILGMIAKKLEEEGLTNVKIDAESGELTAEMDLT